MKAIVLCAGQGKRLLPLTEGAPKCLLPVDGERTILELQLDTLARCGVTRASVVVGFRSELVEDFLASRPIAGIETEAIFNPFYALTDNLVSCWFARDAMTSDFLLLNGDTLFEEEVLRRVLTSRAPRVVTIDRKERYDDDDMKVELEGSRLRAIGKTLPRERVNAESIGLLAFRGAGVHSMRSAFEAAVRSPDTLHAWYLSAVNTLAQRLPVETVSAEGLWWREIDDHADLEELLAGTHHLSIAFPGRSRRAASIAHTSASSASSPRGVS